MNSTLTAMANVSLGFFAGVGMLSTAILLYVAARIAVEELVEKLRSRS